MMMARRGLGDDTPMDLTPAPLDVGQLATWGWYGVALMLAVVFIGTRLLGSGEKTRKRRK